MKKTSIALLGLLLVALLLFTAGFAETETDPAPDPVPDHGEENGLAWKQEGEGISITKYTGNEANVTIPSSIQGLPVIKLNGGVFYENTSIVSVTMPDTITELQNGGTPDGTVFGIFEGCTSLTNVNFSNSISELHWHLFKGCTALRKVTLPSALTKLHNDTFVGCELTEVHLPDNLTDIEWDGLPGLDVPETPITWKIFCKKDSATAKYISLNRPSGSTHSFYEEGGSGMLALSWVRENGAEQLAISSCDPEVTSLVIPDGISNLSPSVFKGCTKLTSVTLSNSITKIPARCFEGCIALSSISMPSRVTSVGDYAFAECAALTELPAMHGVTRLGSHAFENCSGLHTAILPSTLGDSALGSYVFSGCSNLRSITLPNNAEFTAFPDGTFYKCTSLITVDTSNIYYYGKEVFFGCSSLVALTIADGNFVLSDGFAQYCGALKAVEIPQTVMEISETAFTTDKGYAYTVYGVPGSVAEKWTNAAHKKNKNIVFRKLGSGATVIIGPDKYNDRIEGVGEVINWRDDYVLLQAPAGCQLTCTSSNTSVASVTGDKLNCLSAGATKITARTSDGASWEYTLRVYNHVKSFSLPPVLYCKDYCAFKFYDKDTKAHEYVPLNNIYPAKDYLPTFTYELSLPGMDLISGTSSDGHIAFTPVGGPGRGSLTVISASGVTRTAEIIVYEDITGMQVKSPSGSGTVMLGEEVFVDVEMHLQVGNENVTCRGADLAYFINQWESTPSGHLKYLGANRVVPIKAGMVTLKIQDVYWTHAAYARLNIIAKTDDRTSSGLPSGLVKIADGAFANTGYKWVKINARCESIGSKAFASCPRLERVYIPSTVKAIADDAFAGSHVTIYAEANSYAIEYAQKHGIDYRFN